MKISDMPKLESPFIRKTNERGEYVVIPEINPDCAWVFEGGEGDVLATEKLDGCLHYQVPILTDKGSMTIGEIVNQKRKVNVLSYNFNKKVTEFKPIIHYHKERRLRPFLNIKIKTKYHGTVPRQLICTDNHKFYTPSGWKEAKELKNGDKIFHLIKKLDFVRQQFILGGLLGDSSIHWGYKKKSCGFGFIHSVAQKEYFCLKLKILRNILSEVRGNKGGFCGSKENRRANSVINVNISDFLKEKCSVNNKKCLTAKWINELSPIALAIWYMDDGFLCNGNNKQRDRASFSTNAYNAEKIKNIQKKLKYYNIKSNIQNSSKSKGNILALTSDGSDIFFNLVAPFIIKEMQYKLPKRFRTGKCYWDNYILEQDDDLIETEITDVTREYKSRRGNSDYQYDIQVADNSNYFAHRVLVHNTDVSIVIENGIIASIWNRTARIPFFCKGKEHIVEGVMESFKRGYTELPDGQWFGEVIGEKLNGNPCKIQGHLWIPFTTYCREHLSYKSWHKYPKTFENISDWFRKPISEGGIFSLFMKKRGIDAKPEGIVFHNLKTGQMAKLRMDMFEWFSGRRHDKGECVHEA